MQQHIRNSGKSLWKSGNDRRNERRDDGRGASQVEGGSSRVLLGRAPAARALRRGGRVRRDARVLHAGGWGRAVEDQRRLHDKKQSSVLQGFAVCSFLRRECTLCRCIGKYSLVHQGSAQYSHSLKIF